MHVRNRGGKVIVINPVVETGLVNFSVPSSPWSLLFGTKIASIYVQPHIGGDLALLTGIAKRIDETGARTTSRFCASTAKARTLGSRISRALAWDEIHAKSRRRPRGDRRHRRTLRRRRRRVVFSWTMGITHHAHGVQNVQAIANLALLRGMVGRPGAGLLPIRGHSNVQGIGIDGRHAEAEGRDLRSARAASSACNCRRRRASTRWPAWRRRTQGDSKFGLCLGGNLYGSNPDATLSPASRSAKLDSSSI